MVLIPFCYLVFRNSVISIEPEGLQYPVDLVCLQEENTLYSGFV